MNKSYWSKIEKIINNFLRFLHDKKQQMYKNNKSSTTINVLRLVFAVVLFVIAVYAGTKFAIYGAIFAVLVIAGYFLLPPQYLEKEFADKVKKEAVELGAKAKDAAVKATQEIKKEVSKISTPQKVEKKNSKPKAKAAKKPAPAKK